MIKPALTREEWERALRGMWFPDDDILYSDHDGQRIALDHHAEAALRLHGQEYGFTREDVELLRDIEGDLNHMHWGTREVKVMRLADRIEALLPPEEE